MADPEYASMAAVANDPALLKRTINLLHDQLTQCVNDRDTLALALRDIRAIAEDNIDLDSPWNGVWHICQTVAVQNAMASE